MIWECWALCQQLDLSGAHPYGQDVQQSLQDHLTRLIVQHLTPCQDNYFRLFLHKTLWWWSCHKLKHRCCVAVQQNCLLFGLFTFRQTVYNHVLYTQYILWIIICASVLILGFIIHTFLKLFPVFLCFFITNICHSAILHQIPLWMCNEMVVFLIFCFCFYSSFMLIDTSHGCLLC